VIARAKHELLENGFIFMTVMGRRPNKASWYAVTWRSLDRLTGYDAGAEQLFERGAYRKPRPVKNASLTPPNRVDSPAIVPAHGVVLVPPTVPHGAIRPASNHPSTPSRGDHLETPSVGAVRINAKFTRGLRLDDPVSAEERERRKQEAKKRFLR
jgi:hypothetical protein